MGCSIPHPGQGCPPRVVRGAARHAAIASSVNQTVKLPRWRRPASWAAQFVTLRFCFGMWWRPAALALNAMTESRIRNGKASYPNRTTPLTGDPCNNAPQVFIIAACVKRARPLFSRVTLSAGLFQSG
jgi:hypothetical protein